MPFVNIDQMAAVGMEYVFYGVKNDNYMFGVTGAIANGASAGMGRFYGATDLNITEPDAEFIDIPGNNGIETTVPLAANTFASGTITTSVEDMDYRRAAGGPKIYADGDFDEQGGGENCLNLNNLCMIINSPGRSRDSAALNSPGYRVQVYNLLLLKPKSFVQIQGRTALSFPSTARALRASATPWGRAFSVLNDGFTELSTVIFYSQYPVTQHTAVSDGTTTPFLFTLNETPVAASGTAVQLYKNGVKATYTTDYTVNATTRVVSVVAPGTAGDIFTVKYKFVPSC